MIKNRLAADSSQRIKLLLDTCAEELLKQQMQIEHIRDQLSQQDDAQKSKQAKDLLLDAARKASSTRSLERVKRIGKILANSVAVVSGASEADEVEEMMRVAVDLSDIDVLYLRELMRIEGARVKTHGRIERYDAHTLWVQGSWGTKPKGEIDSVFSKLESYGLVSRVPPPNNLNIMADFQNRYVLLAKGLYFVELITSRASVAS